MRASPKGSNSDEPQHAIFGTENPPGYGSEATCLAFDLSRTNGGKRHGSSPAQRREKSPVSKRGHREQSSRWFEETDGERKNPNPASGCRPRCSFFPFLVRGPGRRPGQVCEFLPVQPDL